MGERACAQRADLGQRDMHVAHVLRRDAVVGAHRAFHRVQPPVLVGLVGRLGHVELGPQALGAGAVARPALERAAQRRTAVRSEEHPSELQSLMRISYAVFCLKKNTTTERYTT